MEMAQPQYPLVLLSDLAHPRQIVDPQCPYTVPDTRRDGRHGLLPARSTFFPRQQQWVQEGGVIASARLERGQVQDPRYCVELEPQAIGQQHERSARELLWRGARGKTSQRPAKSGPIPPPSPTRAPGEKC